MKGFVKNAILATAVTSIFLLVSGCNTMHGLGEDVSAGGKALSTAAAGKDKGTTAKKKASQTAKTTTSKTTD